MIEKDVIIEVVGRKIFVSLPQNDDDIRFIISLRYSKWDSKNRQWIVPDYLGNLDLIRKRFGTRVSRLIVHETIPISVNGVEREIDRNELLKIKELAIAKSLKVTYEEEPKGDKEST